MLESSPEHTIQIHPSTTLQQSQKIQKMESPTLVGGIPTPLKNDGVRHLLSLFPIYENMKAMFQTTNQWM
jgi:hypothetical protein